MNIYLLRKVYDPVMNMLPIAAWTYHPSVCDLKRTLGDILSDEEYKILSEDRKISTFVIDIIPEGGLFEDYIILSGC